MRRHRFPILLVLGAILFTTGALAFAGKWKPYEFNGAASYKYRITTYEDGGQKDLLFGFDLEPSTTKNAAGETQWRVTTTTQSLMNEDELKGAALFGVSPVLSMAPAMMLGNPMFGGLIGEMELEVGEKMSFFGMGKAVVTKKETVGGIEGYVCELYMKQDEGERKVAELVVHPDLAFPLRSRVYDEDQLQFQMELLEYKKP